MKASLPTVLACLWLAGCTTFTRPAEDGTADSAEQPDSAGPPDTAVPADAPDADAKDAPDAPDVGEVAGDSGNVDAPDVPDHDAPTDAAGPDADALVDALDVADTTEPLDVDAAAPDGASCTGEPCVTPGLLTCSLDGSPTVFVCAEGPGGCLDWVQDQVCDAGLECRKGHCGADACPYSGALQCAGPDSGAFRICAGDGSGFLVWGDPIACPAGSACSDGVCGQNACKSEGSTACYGAAQTIVCQADATGFLSWSLPQACIGGGVCKAGTCGSDACSFAGQVECLDDETARTCVSDPVGFLSWGEPTSCPSKCSPSSGCGGVCEPGEKVCAGGTAAVTCQESAGEPYWSAPLDCPPKTVCKGAGLCGKDQCLVEGTLACSSAAEGERLVCTLEPTGFLAWSPGVPCPDGDECRPGGYCGHDECQPGAVACIDALSSLAQSCELQADGFYRWGVPFTCPAGSFCLGGAGCVPNGPIALSTATLAASAGPLAAALPAGETLVVWSSAGSPDRIVTRRVDIAGNPLGGAEQPLSAGDGAQSEPAVAVAGDGSALVAWTEAATGGSIVRSAALSPTGDAAPAVTLSQLEGTNGAPAVVALPSGGYYVFWEAQGAPCAGPQCIVRRLVTADGMPKGEPGVALDEGAGVTLTTPSAAATPSGDVWLSMRRVEAAPGLCDLAPTCANPPCCAGPDVVQGVQAMRFAPGGAVDLAPTLVEIISGATLLAGQVAAGPAAQQARIVWTGQPLTSEKGVQFRCLGSLGASCSTRHVSKGGGSAQAAAAVAPHAGGSFVVAWTGLVGSSSAQHVFTRHVDAEGAPLADPRQASLGLVGTHGRPTVVLRDDGANVVVWEVHDAGTGASSVRLRILEE